MAHFYVCILFVSPTNLHCSQTHVYNFLFPLPFVSPTNLHCSQTFLMHWKKNCSLFPLRIYTALKPEVKETEQTDGLFPLRIYTALKHKFMKFCDYNGLFPLQIYTALKRQAERIIRQTVCFPYKFTLLSNPLDEKISGCWFVSPTNLHCSQTGRIDNRRG